MKKSKIEKDSKIPLHFQIYNDLLNMLDQGVYQINDKMPSEPELMNMYGVSRITVRSAMQELEQKGRIKKFRGVGTIVCEPKQEYNLQHLSSFSADTNEHGGHPSSELIQFSYLHPGAKVAAALQINADEKVYYIERKRIRGNTIIGLNKAYIKKTHGLVLAGEDFTKEASLYSLLKEQGIHLRHAVELLEAQLSTPGLSELLNIKKNQPIFYKERTTFDEYNEAIEYVEIYYRADIYQYRVSLNLEKGEEADGNI